MHTISQLFHAAIEHNLDRALLHKVSGEWVPISSQELYRSVAGVSQALLAWGIAKGDRVAILSENRPEWLIADLAAMTIGAVVVPIYPTLTAEQVAWLLRDSSARTLFASSAEQLKKFFHVQAHVSVEQLVIMDSGDFGAGVVPMQQLMKAGPSGRDAEWDQRTQQVAPGDLATIIYTSGTTGDMKGVMLTHRNLASNEECSLLEFSIGRGDRHVSFLPLSHVTARHVDFGLLHRGVTIFYCSQ
ncbi:MAG: AMP-binding protein, partial [Candidatus Korobacteraceae bacterium]